MGKNSEPEGGQEPILTAHDMADNPHGGTPIQINHKNYTTGPKGILSLKEFVNTYITSLVINSVKIPIPNGKHKVKEHEHLSAHVNSRLLRIL